MCAYVSKYICMCVCVHAPWPGTEITCECQFFPSTVWVLGVKLRSLGLPLPIEPSHQPYFLILILVFTLTHELFEGLLLSFHTLQHFDYLLVFI